MHYDLENYKSDYRVEHLLQEIAAAPTRRDAERIFWGADWLFIDMDRKARERIYVEIESLIWEKRT